ncbi:MAG: divergent polysaccharide deacetylase family protein [Alphaproteobacteria bacterium]|nr:divergent polysaccharide deacetylase family protein [Alphaproteobacteria bacterium]
MVSAVNDEDSSGFGISWVLVAYLVLAAALSVLFAWLYLGGEDTVSRRILATPRVTIPLTARGPSVPVSSAVYSADGKIAEAKPPEAKPDEKHESNAAKDEASKSSEQSMPTPARPEGALSKAPDLELLEETPAGNLPTISGDGRQPWQFYARPFPDADTRPRISVVLTGLGLSRSSSEAAIKQLPGTISLSFAPYADKLDDWIETARLSGHEVLLDLPMEPASFPRSDPGPYTLLTSLSVNENLDRLDWIMARAGGYIGLTTMQGSRFVTSDEQLRPMLGVLKRRGLMFLDARSTSRSLAAAIAAELTVPRALNNRFIDNEITRPAIDRKLQELEQIARETGFAVGIGQTYPVTIERLAAWAATLESRGMALAPISALVNKQSFR